MPLIVVRYVERREMDEVNKSFYLGMRAGQPHLTPGGKYFFFT